MNSIPFLHTLTMCKCDYQFFLIIIFNDHSIVTEKSWIWIPFYDSFKIKLGLKHICSLCICPQTNRDIMQHFVNGSKSNYSKMKPFRTERCIKLELVDLTEFQIMSFIFDYLWNALSYAPAYSLYSCNYTKAIAINAFAFSGN